MGGGRRGLTPVTPSSGPAGNRVTLSRHCGVEAPGCVCVCVPGCVGGCGCVPVCVCVWLCVGVCGCV